MERDYFKAVNVETGEEKLAAIPPAVPVISRQKLADELKYDARTGFCAAVFGAMHPDAIMAVARGKMTAEEYNLRMIEWMVEWEPDITTAYDENGNERKRPQAEESDSEADPLQ